MHTKQKPIVRFKANESLATEDTLAIEEPLAISLVYEKEGILQQKNIAITMRTPGNDKALAAGFLFTEGIISTHLQIEKISQYLENECVVSVKKEADLDLSKIERHFYTTSSCGVCGKSSIDAVQILQRDYQATAHFQVKKELFLTLNEKVRAKQLVFKSTGGLHAAALFDRGGECRLLAEDVGRHNALDKLIGEALLAGKLPLAQHILFLSGRASFELIQKAAMAQIPIICALGAPSSLAVELAEATNTTLIGFLKADSFNIYAGKERIL